MMDAEWLTCQEPLPMLEWLKGAGRVSRRKCRLFACACARAVWGWLAGPFRAAVETAERVADGHGRPGDLSSAYRACQDAFSDLSRSQVESPAWMAARCVCERPAYSAAWQAAVWATEAHAQSDEASGGECSLLLARLCRCVNGSRRTPSPLPAVHQTMTARHLAEAAYESRQVPTGRFDNARLAVLSDALEEAGCTDDALLSHLRSPGPHVRGCWALDLVLGRE